MSNPDDLHRLSNGEVNLINNYRRLSSRYRGFIDRTITDAADLSDDKIHPPSNILPFQRQAQIL